MGLEQAQNALDGFFTAYPDLHRHLQYNAQISRRRGYIRIEPSGRIVPAEWEGGYLSYQQCCNLPIQGGAADLMLLAIQLVYPTFRKARIRGGLIPTVHDELIAEVAEDDAEAATEIMHREMVRAFEISFPGAPTTGLLVVKSATIGVKQKRRTTHQQNNTSPLPHQYRYQQFYPSTPSPIPPSRRPYRAHNHST
jgi:hypothetical protein